MKKIIPLTQNPAEYRMCHPCSPGDAVRSHRLAVCVAAAVIV